jgi:2-polyprenyl-3-methyl-5-hydroxy-6-metoxy-1,4-benzoquinol methylase
MCEPLAARDALVVGVDAATNNIAAARLHSAAGVHSPWLAGLWLPAKPMERSVPPI